VHDEYPLLKQLVVKYSNNKNNFLEFQMAGNDEEYDGVGDDFGDDGFKRGGKKPQL